VLTWGEGAEVLRPDALRDDMARTHQAAAARYGTTAKPNA
jgi:predicted DNA-binding transcriptional regulator YafY